MDECGDARGRLVEVPKLDWEGNVDGKGGKVGAGGGVKKVGVKKVGVKKVGTGGTVMRVCPTTWIIIVHSGGSVIRSDIVFVTDRKWT
jgi:hypothetical protein